MRGERAARFTLVSCIGLVAPTLQAAIAPVGIEFQVNTFTDASQSRPAVAAGDSGFVVVWQSDGQDGDVDGVFARRFSTSGAALASEFQVSSFTSSWQYYAAVALDASGDFVVVWQSFTQDGFSNGVFAKRFDSSGAILGAEFRVNSSTVNDERYAALAMDGDGDFVVAWVSFPGDTSSDGVFAQRFDSAGTAQAVEFQVNSFTVQTQAHVAIGMSAAGDFVVAWQSFGQDGGDYGIFARRFDSNGVGLAIEFQVNARTSANQTRPAVVEADSGDFVIAWQSFFQDADANGVFAQRFDSTGAKVGVEFQVNTYSTNDQRYPAVTAAGSGFVVTWSSFGEDGSSDGVFGRSFDSSGTPKAGAFQVNTFTESTQIAPAIASDGAGGFVVAWQSFGQDTAGYGVFAQRLAESELATLDIDGNGAVAPLSDGLLVLRFLFSFSGAPLTSGAVAGNCTRCTANEISGYLNGLGNVLDVDGNLTLGPLTDGLLILRFVFGFGGTTLTNNAVGGGCSRCDAGDIVDYLQPLVV